MRLDELLKRTKDKRITLDVDGEHFSLEDIKKVFEYLETDTMFIYHDDKNNIVMTRYIPFEESNE